MGKLQCDWWAESLAEAYAEGYAESQAENLAKRLVARFGRLDPATWNLVRNAPVKGFEESFEKMIAAPDIESVFADGEHA